MFRLPQRVLSAAEVGQSLGVTCSTTRRCPWRRPGYLVFYYGGWTLGELYSFPTANLRMWPKPSSCEVDIKASAGYYAVQLRVPHSAAMTWDEQSQLLDRKWWSSLQPLPMAVVATGLLVSESHHVGWIRCAEESSNGFRAILGVKNGRVAVCYHNDGDRHPHLWIAAGHKL